MKYDLGIIELGDSVVVSDPSYELGVWCAEIIEHKVRPGKYHGFMDKVDFGDEPWEGIRVTNLWVVHEDYINKIYPDDLNENADIGVDTGSAGIYDLEYYKKYHPIHKEGPSADWYDRQFDLRYYYDINGNNFVEPILKRDPKTKKEKRIISGQERRDGIALDNKCVISFSGFGDGSYNLYTASDEEGKIIGIRIEFIFT